MTICDHCEKKISIKFNNVTLELKEADDSLVCYEYQLCNNCIEHLKWELDRLHNNIVNPPKAAK